MVELHTLLAHILAQTRQNVQLLIAHGQISQIDGEEILFRLTVPAAERSEQPSVASLTQQTQHLTMSPVPKREARAIWGWTSEDPNDLSFEVGEIVEVITETNDDWWMGRNRSGKQGLFPSNYVEKLPSRSSPPILVPEPRKSVTSVHSNGPVEQRYSSPALPYPPPRVQPQPYTATSQLYRGGYDPPAGPPPGAVNYSYEPPPGPPTQQSAPQQAPAKNKYSALGQAMVQPTASEAGFGAGVAIGNGIMNSPF